jgi:hypothetical protein
VSERLPSHVEAGGLIRQVQSIGGFAAVLHRGDPDRGAMVLLVAHKGVPHSLVERRLADDFSYRWTQLAARELDWAGVTRDRPRIDPDCWLIELDVPDAERFIAEMIAEG